MRVCGKQNTGFTLIELISVILIIGIIAAIAIPAFNYNPNKLDAAANKLMADLKYAQHLAMSRNTTCGILFNVGSENYFVYIGTSATKATDPYGGGDYEVTYTTDTRFKGVDLSSTNFGNTISFDFEGQPYNSAGVSFADAGTNQRKIVLMCDGKNMKVWIRKNTGYVWITG